jgi:hypothetical protein
MDKPKKTTLNKAEVKKLLEKKRAILKAQLLITKQ